MSDDVNKLIGRIIASTKRKKRNLSIVEIALDIQRLKEKTGGIQKVAELVGISPGMLNQFLSVFKLPENVQELVAQKKIDSVTQVFMLSKFPESEIQQMVEPIKSGELRSDYLKVLLPYRRRHPNQNLFDIIEKVSKSKNIKVAIIRLPKNLITKKEILIKAIKEKIGKENFISLEEINDSIDITITKEGEKALKMAASENNVTLSKFIQRLLNYAR